MSEAVGKSDGSGGIASQVGPGDVIEEGNAAKQDGGSKDDDKGLDLGEATERAPNGLAGNGNEGGAAAAASTRFAAEGTEDDGGEVAEEASNGDVWNENEGATMTPTRYAAAAAAAASTRLAAAASGGGTAGGGAISFPRGAYPVTGPGFRGGDGGDEEANSGAAATPGENVDRSTPHNSNGNGSERGNNSVQSTVLSAAVNLSERADDPAVEATRVEDETVYDAEQIPTGQVSAPVLAHQRVKYRRAVLLASAASVALAVGLSLGLNNDDTEEGKALTQPGLIVLSNQPSQSAHPSPSPSYHPTSGLSSAPSSYWSTLKWEQLGDTFIGEAARDEFGKSVSLSADLSIMAIGAPAHDKNGPNSGQVKVYIWDESALAYKERQSLYGREANREFFGVSLSLSADGKTLAVGAPGADINGFYSGELKVYVWDENASRYNELQSFYGDAADDRFGIKLAVSDDGKTIAVGAVQIEAGRGYVTVYVWDDASSNYVQQDDIMYGDSDSTLFGHQVSLSSDGEIMAVSAINEERSGQVKVYARDKASTEGYVEVQSIYGQRPGSLLAADSLFGAALTLSPDKRVLAVSAPGQGMVQVFEWDDASSTYKELHSIYDEANRNPSGVDVDWMETSPLSMSADGKTLAVGSPNNGAKGDGTGQVKVYVWDDASAEYRHVGDALDGEEASDLFGFSLSLSEDGKTLAIGATQWRNYDEAGKVKIFHVEYEDEL